MNKVYQIITDKILEQLNNGVVPWRKPWDQPTAAPLFLQHNYVSGHAYRGINVWLTAFAGYQCPAWVTMNQLNKLGHRLQPNQRSTLVIYWNMWKPDQDKEEQKPVLRYYKVWNLEQTTVPWTMADQPTLPQSTADDIVKQYDGPSIIHDNVDAAYYIPLADSVHMPMPDQFPTTDDYYQVLFHELAHSTGHESRLARKELRYYQLSSRPMEELIAEITASFLCAVARLEPDIDRSAAYIDVWRKRISEDPELVVKAASKAQKASDLILGKIRGLAAPNEEKEAEELELVAQA